MRYSQKMPTVDAVEWTKDLATAAERMNDAKFPAAEKQKFREFDEFFSDQRGDVDGTWLSVINPHEDADWGKYGVYCARDDKWKPLSLGSMAVRYAESGTFDVFDSDEFEARYEKSAPRSVSAVKKEGDAK